MRRLHATAICFLLSASVLSVATARDAAGLPPAAVPRDGPSGATSVISETLLKTESSWDGVNYAPYAPDQPELTVIRLTIAPHTTLPWHTHPMPNAAYVVSGELVVQRAADGKERKLTAGDVLAEMVDTVHRGRTGETPVELIVFYAGASGMPLSTPADCESDCGGVGR